MKYLHRASLSSVYLCQTKALPLFSHSSSQLGHQIQSFEVPFCRNQLCQVVLLDGLSISMNLISMSSLPKGTKSTLSNLSAQSPSEDCEALHEDLRCEVICSTKTRDDVLALMVVHSSRWCDRSFLIWI